jgi:hypothetical protein
MHIILYKVTLINLARVSKVIFALTVELAINEVSLIVGAIELESSLTSFLSFDEVSSVDNLTFVPHLLAESMLPILVPLALVKGAVFVHEHSLAMCLAIKPLSLVDVPIGVGHATFAIEHLIFSEAFVLGAIFKLDDTEAFPCCFTLFPVAFVLPVQVDCLEIVVPSEEFTLLFEPFFVFYIRH